MRFPAHIMTDTIQNSVRNVLRGNKRYPFVLMLEPLYTSTSPASAARSSATRAS